MSQNILYKYFPIDSKFTNNLRVAFSIKRELNDPFELLPSHNALNKAMESNTLYQPVFSIFESEQELLEPKKMIKDINDPNFGCPIFHHYGIFCLSGKRDNILMWSHYASNHTGFVIGFDANHPFFNQNLNDSCFTKAIGNVEKVEYKQDKRRATSSAFESWFLQKAKDWEYEDEYRMILPVKNADRIMFKAEMDDWGKVIKEARFATDEERRLLAENNYIGEGFIPLFSVPESAIVSLTLGAQCDLSKQLDLVDYFSAFNPELEVGRMSIASDTFELEYSQLHSFGHMKIETLS
ncbi:DUF2971 domain-containing protein [Vibrio rotiferianus]|uniref:DUF2971 domain-containing protein n=1 Tax=Vibrio rotiferianus TaxID=190895 RepID=UPI001360B6A0|nr:DUF2971 domain-containing protein [Vibrio rotiferianus]